MRKRPLFMLACVFLMGIVYQRYRALEVIFVLFLFISIEIFYGIKCERFKIMAVRSIVLLSAFVLGICHMYHAENFRDTYLSKLKEGDSLTVWGEIYKIQDTDYGVCIYLSDCCISLKDGIKPCNNIMVYTSSAYYQVGEIHKVIGQFNTFPSARNQGNFDSQTFYQSQKIDFLIMAEETELVAFKVNWIRDGILTLKERLKSVYDTCLKEKTAGFYIGLILGDKSNLDENLKVLFATGGIAHILAVSGLHVSIVGRGIYKRLRKIKFGFFGAGTISTAMLLSYCYMTGNGMSAIRAVGMMVIYFLAQYWGRSYDMLNALGAMCIGLLLENPFLLEYSGFWFSVTAIIGIGSVSQVFSWKMKRTAGLWMSLGISVTTLPITACCYYEIPFYAPLVNALVLPLLTPIFCIALLGGFIGIVFPGIARVCLIPCHWGLVICEWLCEVVNKLPGGSILTGSPSKNRIILYYVILIVGIGILKVVREKTKAYFVTKVGLAALCFLTLIFPRKDMFEISFLDVGQGDGIYLSLPDDTKCFIDGGSSDVDMIGKYRILPFLKSKQVKEIDYWFVTHADTDHMSGLLEVLDSGYSIKNIVMSYAAPNEENRKSLLDAAKENGTKVLFMKAGDRLKGTTWCITCLYPGKERIEDKNEASLVLQLDAKRQTKEEKAFKALFTGDISTEVEELLLKEGMLKEIWLYKAAHHGSKYSNSFSTLKNLHPKVAVISCGKNNIYGHPAKEVISNMKKVGANIYYTMESGQIRITYDEAKKGLVIEGISLIQ